MKSGGGAHAPLAPPPGSYASDIDPLQNCIAMLVILGEAQHVSGLIDHMVTVWRVHAKDVTYMILEVNGIVYTNYCGRWSLCRNLSDQMYGNNFDYIQNENTSEDRMLC